MISTSTSSPLQMLPDLVNHHLIHMICPAMMTKTECSNASQKRHTDEVIMLHAYSLLQASI